MPTIYFYRYNGSITEPPCKDVTWWVMSEPTVISHAQLIQLRRILFTHVDENCARTSVHNADESSARPIFPAGDLVNDGIEKCTSAHFEPDDRKGRGRGRECKCNRKCWGF